MILYTMMPHELVFASEEEEYSKQRIVDFQGVPVLVETVAGDSARILRVMSSDPQHYLDERYTPGTKISLLQNGGLSSF